MAKKKQIPPTIITLILPTPSDEGSHLKITGAANEPAHNRALLIAGQFIDGGLWDGKSPIRIDDVAAVARKMECLTVKDLSLFTLDDFV